MLLGAPVPNLEPRVPPSAAGMQGFGLGDDLGGLTLRPSRVPPHSRRDTRLALLGCGWFGRLLLPGGVSASCLMLIIAATRLRSRHRASLVCLAQFGGTAKASEQIPRVARQRGLIPTAPVGPDRVVTAS